MRDKISIIPVKKLLKMYRKVFVLNPPNALLRSKKSKEVNRTLTYIFLNGCRR